MSDLNSLLLLNKEQFKKINELIEFNDKLEKQLKIKSHLLEEQIKINIDYKLFNQTLCNEVNRLDKELISKNKKMVKLENESKSAIDKIDELNKIVQFSDTEFKRIDLEFYDIEIEIIKLKLDISKIKNQYQQLKQDKRCLEKKENYLKIVEKKQDTKIAQLNNECTILKQQLESMVSKSSKMKLHIQSMGNYFGNEIYKNKQLIFKLEEQLKFEQLNNNIINKLKIENSSFKKLFNSVEEVLFK